MNEIASSITPEQADNYIKDENRRIRNMRRRGLAQPIRVNRLNKQMPESHNEDANLFHSEDGPVVLGVYGVEDWIESDMRRTAYKDGVTILQLDGTWLTNADFDLAKWAKELGTQYTFYGANSVTCYAPDGSHIKVKYGRSKIEVEIIGEPKYTEMWFKYFDSTFKKAENLIQWIYNSQGHEISVPLNFRPAIRAAYPWIDSSYVELTDYIDEYIDSDASVLILIGAPGTGKTTFIKNLIHRSKANAKVAYDPKVMMEDSFFAGFIGDDTRFLVMEDADEFLRSRTEGNTMMHKFLNVSDGLISAADKKLVFSTNLPNIGDIDEALMREGRCFDVLQFEALDRKQAQAVLNAVDSKRILPDGNHFTLAECFSSRPNGKGFKRHKIGFMND
jgi:molybdopterin-guanine dinucleotide biosynthesis protein